MELHLLLVGTSDKYNNKNRVKANMDSDRGWTMTVGPEAIIITIMISTKKSCQRWREYLPSSLWDGKQGCISEFLSNALLLYHGLRLPDAWLYLTPRWRATWKTSHGRAVFFLFGCTHRFMRTTVLVICVISVWQSKRSTPSFPPNEMIPRVSFISRRDS